jgi:alkane 1-monooxygenase
MAYVAFTFNGFYVWLVPLYAFAFIPLIELLIKPNAANLSTVEEELVKQDKVYDYLLYVVVVMQLIVLVYFLSSFKNASITNIELVGRILSMGILCGTFGINVGHELGHRKNKGEKLLANISLMTSLYMHFFIEHNKGHHKNVATPKDPSSARYNEMLYFFFPRTIFFSYLSAWHIANDEVKKAGNNVFSLYNAMIQIHLIQLAFVLGIYFVFGTTILLYFFVAALIGILLLETVNYIEHYGLQRKETANGNYERAMPHHSWNSNHVYGRLILFELSRHSDHHYLASRKYQILRHHEDAPQLPTGYPGSMLLSLVPPLWFWVMNRKIRNLTK